MGQTVCAHLGHMGVGDGVGVPDIDVFSVVELHRQGGQKLQQPGKVIGGAGGQKGLFQHAVGLKVIQGGAIGQNHRRVDGGQMGIGGEGAVGPPGGDGKPAPLPQEILDGPQVALRDPPLVIIQGVVKVADQQQPVKFSHRALALRSNRGFSLRRGGQPGAPPTEADPILAVSPGFVKADGGSSIDKRKVCIYYGTVC